MEQATIITDADCLSCLGQGLGEHCAALMARRSGLTRSHRFTDLIQAPLGVVSFGEWANSPSLQQSDELYWLMATRIIDNIARRSRVFDRYRPEDIGMFLGTTTYGVGAALDCATGADLTEFSRRLSCDMTCGAILDRIRAAYPIRGSSLCFANSCASSAMAIGEAARALDSGLFQAVFAGGFDVLTPVSIMGFDALQVLNHDFSEPLTGKTEGINLGEGGGLLLMERAEDKAPDARLGRVVGYAAGNDAFHPVKPNPDGSGIARVMRSALADAKASADAICYLNAHGTGTPSNDTSESAAIQAVFGARPMYHSTKGLHGHTLGAGGALEACVCLIALGGMHEWCLTHDLALPATPHGLAMSNSFGFGGAGACLILGR